MSQVLSRLSLKYQIGSLVLLAGVILGISGGLGWTTRHVVAAVEQRRSVAAQLSIHASQLDVALLQARRHEKDFLLRRDSRYISQQQDSVAAARVALDALASDIPAGDARGAQIDQLRQGLTAYGDNFTRLVEFERKVGLSENDGLMGALRSSVHEAEALLKTHDDPRLTILMLMMRRHEKDFLARKDVKYVDELKARGDEFAKALAGSTVPAAERATLQARMTTYQTDFAAAAAAVIDAAAATAALSASYTQIEPLIASLVDDANQKRVAARQESARITTIGDQMQNLTMTLGVALMLVLGWLLARSIYQPLQRIADAMQGLAAHDLAVAIPGTARRDEIGGMARSVVVFRDSMQESDRLRRQQEQDRLAAERDKVAALQLMADTVEQETGGVVGRVAEESERIAGSASRMAQSAIMVQDNAQRVAAAAQESLASAQAVAGASEELSMSIREIASQVSHSNSIVAETVVAADTASTTVGQLTVAMSAIDEVAQVIAEIASQTNLLALNATIEAARAGDAGKGFAVVANEVKNLATQTARQTEDITQRINTLKQMAERVGRAICSVTATIAGVSEITGSVAAAVEQQDAATQEISRNVQQAALAAQEVSARIVDVANEASASGEQARQVEGQLEAMATQLDELGHVLNRVVRTATPDVNRRSSPRYAIKAKARVLLGGQELDGDLVDISVGGARLTGLPVNATAQSCMLKIEDIQVTAAVVLSKDGVWRVKIDDQHRDQVANWINRQGEKRAA